MCVHSREHEDQLLRWLVGDVHESVDSTSGNAHHIALAGLEPLVVHLEEIAALKDAKYFCLLVPMQGRPEARRIDRLKQGQLTAANVRGYPNGQLKP